MVMAEEGVQVAGKGSAETSRHQHFVTAQRTSPSQATHLVSVQRSSQLARVCLEQSRASRVEKVAADNVHDGAIKLRWTRVEPEPSQGSERDGLKLVIDPGAVDVPGAQACLWRVDSKGCKV